REPAAGELLLRAAEVVREVAALLLRDAPAQLGEHRVLRRARELFIRLRRQALLQRAPEHPHRDEALGEQPGDRRLHELFELHLEPRARADLQAAIARALGAVAALLEQSRDRV